MICLHCNLQSVDSVETIGLIWSTIYFSFAFFSVFLYNSDDFVCVFAWNKTMKDMNVAAQNNISDLLKLARKFNCFYLSGMSTFHIFPGIAQIRLFCRHIAIYF